MNWYVIYTKPRQEHIALKNLERQEYICYLPTIAVEKVRNARFQIHQEPLFPRYLFIQLNTQQDGKSWSPIRSTKGVNKLVTFGIEPAKIASELIETLRHLQQTHASDVSPVFHAGQQVQITQGAFTGFDAIYAINDGEKRAFVLIEVLSKQARLAVNPSHLRSI